MLEDINGIKIYIEEEGRGPAVIFIPDSRFELFEHSGHALINEEKEKFKETVLSFLG